MLFQTYSHSNDGSIGYHGKEVSFFINSRLSLSFFHLLLSFSLPFVKAHVALIYPSTQKYVVGFVETA